MARKKPSKFERCIQHLMDDGWDRDTAARICSVSLGCAGGKMLKYAPLEFEDKTITEDDNAYHFEGYAAVARNVDRVNDVIEAGAFKRTVDQHRKHGWPVTWMHDISQVIGAARGEVDNKGLYIRGDIVKGTAKGDEAYLLMKGTRNFPNGIINALSIGYTIPANKSTVKDGVRHIKEVAVHEIAVTPWSFAANPEAIITAVKTRGLPLDIADVDNVDDDVDEEDDDGLIEIARLIDERLRIDFGLQDSPARAARDDDR